MKYQRTFEIHAAHFNRDLPYKHIWGMSNSDTLSKPTMLGLLCDIHGHNFKIDIELFSTNFIPKIGWLVDDEELARVVNEWHGQNLSVHPDFLDQKIRATTENMAAVLFNKLATRFGNTWNSMGVTITVHETDGVSAAHASLIGR